MILPGGERKHPDILTVDYEDWFHIIRRRTKESGAQEFLPLHVEEDTKRLLDLFDRHRAKATFFVLGWLAKLTPCLLRAIVARGHSLGSHGYDHVPPEQMTKSEFRDDLRRSIDAVRSVTGVSVRGYRAPGFGVRRCDFPYRQVLREFGLDYDASAFPGFFPGRGEPGLSTYPHHPDPEDQSFWEIPVSAASFLSLPVPFSGGGFLRLLPGRIIGHCARKVRAGGNPVVYYVHPRDGNPSSPQIEDWPWNRLRYYGGRKTVLPKLEEILSGRRCVSIELWLSGKDGGSER